MRRALPFLLLVGVATACHDDGPTVPSGSPRLAKDKVCTDPKWADHPLCTGADDGVATIQLALCAKRGVVDEINSIYEGDSQPWPSIGSTDSPCQCGPRTEYCPTGTLAYAKAGPEFEWRFSGSGFVPIDHGYQLIYYPDPWPGRGVVCLGSAGQANRGGRIRLSGAQDLGSDLTEAKIWIVRSNWVDCDGGGFDRRTNLDGVPRLTNDRNADGLADATESCAYPFGQPPYPCDGELAYDWLFETALVTYSDTDS